MFTVPLTLGCLEKRSSDNGHCTRRRKFGFRILPRMRAPPGRDRLTRPRLPRKQEVESWRKISEPSSTVLSALSQLISINNFLEYFIRFYCTTLYFFCLNIYLLYKLFVIIMFIHVIYFLQFFLTLWLLPRHRDRKYFP